MKVAVVWNNSDSQALSPLGQPCPERYGRASIDNVEMGLIEGGHEVAVFQGDIALLDNLRDFFGISGWKPLTDGLVFNMVYGIQGECRYTHIPAMLEMAGIPYTGSSPMGHTLALDKIVTKTLIREAGLPTPAWMVASRPDQDPEGLRFPLMVKPRHESTSFGLRVVHNRAELEDAVDCVLTQFEQEALVEEFIDGREVCIGLLGNKPVECLPPVELCFGGRGLNAFTFEDKMHMRTDEPTRECPADLPKDFVRRLEEISVGVFRACHCKDYSRVDIRLDAAGNPYVLEINSMASLGGGASYVMAAMAAGYTFSSLVCRIVEVAHQRYFGTQADGNVSRPTDRPCDLYRTVMETDSLETQSNDDMVLREEHAA